MIHKLRLRQCGLKICLLSRGSQVRDLARLPQTQHFRGRFASRVSALSGQILTELRLNCGRELARPAAHAGGARG